MSHNFDCVVDTTEMANSMKSVKGHVDTTTGAVVAMKGAVLQAEEEGARLVCKKVNQGFFSLIHSQISQKMAAMQSQVDAKYIRLNQQTKQLLGIRRRMERDYQMICARYAKLFGAINRNLRQRVVELDRPVMDFATTEADKVANRPNQTVACVSLGQSENVKTSQHIAASSLKKRAADTITSIRSFIAASNRLQAVTSRILLPRRTDDSLKLLVAPVAVLESTFDASGNTVTHTFVSDLPMPESARSAVEHRVTDDIRSGQLQWKETSAINPEVVSRFRELVASSSLSRRRRDTMLRLFDAHNFQTF